MSPRRPVSACAPRTGQRPPPVTTLRTGVVAEVLQALRDVDRLARADVTVHQHVALRRVLLHHAEHLHAATRQARHAVSRRRVTIDETGHCASPGEAAATVTGEVHLSGVHGQPAHSSARQLPLPNLQRFTVNEG